MEGKKLNLSTTIKTVLITDLMGEMLDRVRISDLGERQCKQMELDIKKNFYKALKLLNDACVQADGQFTVLPTENIVPVAKSEDR